MTDNELKEIRKKISCPQLGDDHYGRWGALNKSQRFTIKRMLDYIEAQETFIIRQEAEIERLNKQLIFEINSAFDRGKVEAYKECIDKIKNELRNIAKIEWQDNYFYLVGTAFFDNILKELVGDSDA
jgi:hypothetical protein